MGDGGAALVAARAARRRQVRPARGRSGRADPQGVRRARVVRAQGRLPDSGALRRRSPREPEIPIANVRGEISYEEVAGYLEFELDGATVRLDALDDDGDLFVIFRDATSAKTTYRRRPVPGDRAAEGRRLVRRFQQGVQPAVRVFRVHDLPAATAPELDEGGGPGRRALPRAQVLIGRRGRP